MRWLALALALLAAGCQCAQVPDYVFPCEVDADCLREAEVCRAGWCREAADAGP